MAIALRKAPETFEAVEPPRDDVMRDPLHPMHLFLLARISAPRIAPQALTRPPRMTIPFYSAIGAWGLVWLMVETGSALL